ncbi:MAG: porin [Rhodobiaceae bacterium]|nr:porin [Rhodobiaceae bacterium]MCC0041648.1 porin [Rhodobiaceae bacterium]
MNKFKTLLLGTAAATIAATGAMAADAPMGREPVYRCEATGFIELPGTDVCFKVGGWARLIVWAKDDGAGDLTLDTVGGDDFGMETEARINFDARRSTDHGTVRAFIELNATNDDGNSGSTFGLRHGFAQLGNWVFGKTWSTYLHGASDPNGTWLSPIAHTIRIDQIRYTHSVGNGLTLSVAIEDQAYEDQGTTRVLTGAPPTGAVTVNANTGNGGSGENNVPTIVANINYANGGWDAQLSGAVKFNEYSDGSSEVGYGVMLGLAGELTQDLNLVLKVNYTHANPSYAFDWMGDAAPASTGIGGMTTGDDHNQFGIMGGIAGSLSDRVSFQLAGLWGDEDNNGSTQAGVYNIDQQLWGANALIQYQAASGFDFIGEIVYLDIDDKTSANADSDAFYFFGQARARF